ncbi:MAG: glycosyltransferase family 2 protein [Planctomycetes bacterium]|nr:glycosyltransferase family 2 protein [Planctomycetota bacterium]
MVELFFWLSVSVLLYTYAGYPMLLGIVASFRRREDLPGKAMDPPKVSILIAAYNEESVIRGRIQNALDADYPADRLEIVVGSDGCSDGTDEEVESFDDPRVRLFSYPEREGKVSVLNKTIREIKSPIVVFTDANTSFEPAAVRELVKHFAEDAVGAVCGRLEMRSRGKAIGGGNILHRRYEDFLKAKESAIHSCTAANGAIFAVRRDRYPFPSTDSITEDFAIILQVIQNGSRVVFASDSIAYEESLRDVRQLLRQKSRIAAGTFQTLWRFRSLLNPVRSPIAWQLFSHKWLRHASPFFLLSALVTNALLVGHAPYGVLFAAQICFYTVGLGAWLLDAVRVPCGPLKMPYFFCFINLAVLLGFVKFVFGWQRVTWRGARQP